MVNVLIESDWNLKLSFCCGDVRKARTRINRIRLEFKVFLISSEEALIYVLIELDWNLKNTKKGLKAS